MSDIVEGCLCMIVNDKFGYNGKFVTTISFHKHVTTTEGSFNNVWRVKAEWIDINRFGVVECKLKRMDNYDPSLDDIANVINDDKIMEKS